MSKIIDVAIVDDFDLELTYDNGVVCVVNLFNYTNNPCFKSPNLFSKFGLLSNGDLQWIYDVNISSDSLLKIGKEIKKIKQSSNNSFVDLISSAFHDAIIENRPEIIQAAIKSVVNKYGMSDIANHSDLKSRTSIYKSLNEKTNVSLSTIINLSHTIMKLEKIQDTKS